MAVGAVPAITVGLSAGHGVFSSTHWLGIPIALLGAVLLAVGTIFQGRGVAARGAQETRFRRLVRRPVWAVGTSLIGGAILLQLAALRFSPLMVVQPIGASALIVTVLANVRLSRQLPSRRQTLAIILCVAGIAAFVGIASLTAQDVDISDSHLRTILIVLAFAVVGAVVASARNRTHPSAALSTAAAGILYGFVATLVKTVLGRMAQGNFSWLSLAGLVGMGVAVVMGARLVQKAHAGGSDELVVAGLTVVDPLTAVTLGIVVLGEADAAPPQAWAGFVAAGAAAVAGVWFMATSRGPEQRAGRKGHGSPDRAQPDGPHGSRG
ncbi:hypothetical protein GCM10027449_10000 [Sinomonas notoginsengisoli]|uniref:DMT family transporter n=1 Tax=Sinomonas notoginsengisoli TaxID=1457311 RepID=UPI001F29FBC6|nr:DMT family transporter [Sinomonas notoginsengisoli]